MEIEYDSRVLFIVGIPDSDLDWIMSDMDCYMNRDRPICIGMWDDTYNWQHMTKRECIDNSIYNKINRFRSRAWSKFYW